MAKDKVKKEKKKGGGFGLRLTYAIICLLATLALLTVIIIAMPYVPLVIFVIWGVITAYTVLAFIGAFAGRKYAACNVISIVMGALTCAGLIGIFALVGGIKGYKALKAAKRQNSPNENVAETVPTGANEEEPFVLKKYFGNSQNFINLLKQYPVDYQNKPAVSQALDFDQNEKLILTGSNGRQFEFVQLYVDEYDGELYLVAEHVSVPEGEETGYVVLSIDYENDKFYLQDDTAMGEELYARFFAQLKADRESRRNIGKSESNISDGEIKAEPYEYVKSKISKKAQKGMHIAIAISYALFLIAGILLVAVPQIAPVFSSIGICQPFAARAYPVTVGVMWLALLPTFGYFLIKALVSRLSFKASIFILVCSTVLLIAANVAFFFVIYLIELNADLNLITDENLLEQISELISESGKMPVKHFFEGDDVWFIPVSMIFASVAFIVCYVLMLFNTNPSKMNDLKPINYGKSFKYALALIRYYAMKIAKSVISFKEKFPEIYLLLFTVLLTWLVYFVSFIFCIICGVLFIGAIGLAFAGFLSLGIKFEDNAEKIIADGKVLTKQIYSGENRFQSVWKDEYGKEYVSDDNGKTVRERY